MNSKAPAVVVKVSALKLSGGLVETDCWILPLELMIQPSGVRPKLCISSNFPYDANGWGPLP